eukprot:1708865-Rhodomonas_salina.1
MAGWSEFSTGQTPCRHASRTAQGTEGAPGTLGERSGAAPLPPPPQMDRQEGARAGQASRHHQQAAPSPLRAADQTVHPSPSTALRRRGSPEDAEGVRDTCRRSRLQLPDWVSELREFED